MQCICANLSWLLELAAKNVTSAYSNLSLEVQGSLVQPLPRKMCCLVCSGSGSFVGFSRLLLLLQLAGLFEPWPIGVQVDTGSCRSRSRRSSRWFGIVTGVGLRARAGCVGPCAMLARQRWPCPQHGVGIRVHVLTAALKNPKCCLLCCLLQASCCVPGYTFVGGGDPETWWRLFG